MKNTIEMFIDDKKFVVTAIFLKVCKMLNITLNEMYLLIYFNNFVTTFNPVEIVKCLSLSEEEVMEAFDSLLTKGILEVISTKDINGKIVEQIQLSGVKQLIIDLAITSKEKNELSNIYGVFEKELGRTISPMEYEIIESWLNKNISEDLILGALKEATYNGVKSFRYIDKIIYDWNMKGFKTLSDVKSHINSRDNKKEYEELFDYNWLDGDE